MGIIDDRKQVLQGHIDQFAKEIDGQNLLKNPWAAGRAAAMEVAQAELDALNEIEPVAPVDQVKLDLTRDAQEAQVRDEAIRQLKDEGVLTEWGV